MKIRIAYLLAAAFVFSCAKDGQAYLNSLKASFANPPHEARPLVWWHWMDGNITKDGIRKDLEWMDRAGIAGFHHFDAALTTPTIVDRRLVYMTPEWKEAFRYALSVADSLEMEVGIASSPGWSHTGGPWVQPGDAMRKVVWREITVSGGQHFEGPLPEPLNIRGPYQDIPRQNVVFTGITGDGDYKDIAVLALRHDDRQKEILVQGTAISFQEPETISAVTIGCSTTVHLWADGNEIAVVKPSDALVRTVSFQPVSAKHFHLTVDKPSLSPLYAALADLLGAAYARSEGAVTLFKLYTAPRINNVEAKAGFFPEPGLAANSNNTPEYRTGNLAIDITEHFQDGILSWDVPEGEWKIYRMGSTLTGKLNGPAPEEATGLEVDKMDKDAFRRYFRQYLSMYEDAAGPYWKSIRYLLTDSWEAGCENWTPRMREEFTARRGYDPLPWLPAITGEVVSSSAESDAFLADWRRTIGELIAENFDELTLLLKEYDLDGRFSESHESRRALVADGMDIKRTASIPMSAIWSPGPLMGSSLPVAIADMRESASVAHIYGQPVVAAESMTSVGLLQQAYTFWPGNLKSIADLEFASGVNRIVIHESAHQPSDEKVPGLSLSVTGQWFNRHETWAEYARLWTGYLARTSWMMQHGRNVADILVYYGEDTNVTDRYCNHEIGLPKGYNYDFVNPYALENVIQYKNGYFAAPSGNRWKVLVIDADAITENVTNRLEAWKAQGARIYTLADISMDGIPADVISESEYRYVHRTLKDGEYYWVSNPSDDFTTINLSFRTMGRHVSIWNPETGEINPCEFLVADSRTLITWNAQPNDAKFFVFTKDAFGLRPQHDNPVILSETEWSEESLLEGSWHISFQEGRGAPAEAVFKALHSFSEDPDPGVRYFSGTATYSKDFTIDRSGERAVLSLGAVHIIAEVIVNGKSVRTLWKVPYEVEITDYLKEGTNSLEIRVTNLWPNRLIGDASLPESERITYTSFPFYKPDDPLLPAGLIGPVKLVFY